MPRWTEQELRETVAASDSLTDVLRSFGLRAAGGNFALLKRWLVRWDIATAHFSHAGPPEHLRRQRTRRPIEGLLVSGGRASRSQLKRRLYGAGLKRPACELCGQGEEWRGHPLTLILDHVNGVADDNRLENLRIVCPNCNATLPTHCGRNHPSRRPPRSCHRCHASFQSKSANQRYCSRACWQRSRSDPRPDTRKVQRPPHEQLLEEVATSSWSAVGRKYGVSDNAVRKWVALGQRLRAEEHEPAGRGGEEPEERRRGA